MPWVTVAAFELWVHKKNKEIRESTTCQRVTATLPRKDGLLIEPRATQPRGQTLLMPVPLLLTVLGRTDSGTPGPEAWTARSARRQRPGRGLPCPCGTAP